MRIYLIISLLALLFSCSFAVWSATPLITKISKDDGLPTRYPRSLALSPEGVLWAAIKAEQGVNEWMGVAKITGKKIEMFLNEESELNASKTNDLLLNKENRLFVATEKGLRVLGTDGKFSRLGASRNLERLFLSTSGQLWGLGRDDVFKPFILRKTGESVEFFKLPDEGRRPISLYPLENGEAIIVAHEGIISFSKNKMKPLKLKKTPLWKRAVHDPDGPIPSIWIFHAAKSGDSVFLISHTRKLVESKNGIFKICAEGHFGGVIAGKAPETAFVRDYEGALFFWDGNVLKKLYKNEKKGNIGAMFLDSKETLWVEEDLSPEPHRISCFAPPYDNGPIVTFPLGTKDGYLSPGILTMQEDCAGGMWISTNDGIWHLEIKP